MILLDTQALVWAGLEPRRVPRRAARVIEQAVARQEIAIASVTLFEAAQLLARGKVEGRGAPGSWLDELIAALSVQVVELTPEIALVAAHFPPTFPSDPFDRIIAATARVRGLRLVTADARVQASGVVETIW